MAVKKFSNQYGWKIFLLSFLVQLIVVCGLYAIHDSLTRFGDTTAALAVLVIFLIIASITSIIIVLVAGNPIRKIEQAIQYAYHASVDRKTVTRSLDDMLKSIRRLDPNAHKNDDVLTMHEFTQNLLDHLPVGVVAYDKKREIVYSNQAAPVHADGKKLNLAFKDKDSLNIWLDNINSNDITSKKWWNRLRKDVVENEDEQAFYDVLALYQQEGASDIETIIITIDRSSSYAGDEENLDFIAVAAHELRGPITVIKGYLDVLRNELDKNLSNDQKAFFERLEVSADRLGMYINNILNVSHYDRRHLLTKLKEEKLSRIYANIADDLDLRARTQHRLLAVSLPEDLPTIAADRSSLSEVMMNLVDNAIKYSNEGGLIQISAAVNDDSVEVQVKDNGIGIPSNIVPHVFEKFYRSHRSRESTVGTGLGLYISKAIIESHGGTVSVKSEEGHGSTFSFTVPIFSKISDKISTESNVQLIANSANKKYIKNHSLYRE